MEISHATVARFAAARVNLPRDRAQQYHDQVNALRDRLMKKISDDPDFAPVKMLHAGSVAKGVALRTVNDLDVAVYVRRADAPSEDGMVPWLADRLYEANPNMGRDQFVENQHTVTISFRGSGLDVDVVPVLYDGPPTTAAIWSTGSPETESRRASPFTLSSSDAARRRTATATAS